MLLHVHKKRSIYSHHLISHSPINGHDIVSTFSLLQIIPLGLFWHTAFSMFWFTSLAWSPRLKLQRQGKDDFCITLHTGKLFPKRVVPILVPPAIFFQDWILMEWFFAVWEENIAALPKLWENVTKPGKYFTELCVRKLIPYKENEKEKWDIKVTGTNSIASTENTSSQRRAC